MSGGQSVVGGVDSGVGFISVYFGYVIQFVVVCWIGDIDDFVIVGVQLFFVN